MRHKIAGKKLNRTSEHRIALLKNLAQALICNGQIKTTLPKAKALRPFVEKLITTAKERSLHARRVIYSRLHDQRVAKHLVEIVAPAFLVRPGGYTRTVRCGFRYGDNAPMAIIQFVDPTPLLILTEDEGKNELTAVELERFSNMMGHGSEANQSAALLSSNKLIDKK